MDVEAVEAGPRALDRYPGAKQLERVDIGIERIDPAAIDLEDQAALRVAQHAGLAVVGAHWHRSVHCASGRKRLELNDPVEDLDEGAVAFELARSQKLVGAGRCCEPGTSAVLLEQRVGTGPQLPIGGHDPGPDGPPARSDVWGFLIIVVSNFMLLDRTILEAAFSHLACHDVKGCIFVS